MGVVASRISISSAEDGVLLENGVVTLEGASSRHVHYFSSTDLVPAKPRDSGKQILLSEEAYRIVERKIEGASFLPVRYGKPIVLGNMSISLHPSGAHLGSSFLVARREEDSVLYASTWSLQVSPFTRRAEVPSVRRVVLRTLGASASRAGSPRKRMEKFLQFAGRITQEVRENLVVVLGGSQHTAIHLFSELQSETTLPVFASPDLLSLARLYGPSPEDERPPWLSRIRPLSDLGKDSPLSIVLLGKDGPSGEKKHPVPRGIWVWVGREPRGTTYEQVSFAEGFSLDPESDLGDTLQLLRASGCEDVLLTGPGSPLLGTALAREGFPVRLLDAAETLF